VSPGYTKASAEVVHLPRTARKKEKKAREIGGESYQPRFACNHMVNNTEIWELSVKDA
jgi:hypothetical protein